MNVLYDEPYPSFDARVDNPELQACLPSPVPLVIGDAASVSLVCWCFIVAVVVTTCIVVGVVGWPEAAT